MTRAGPGPAPRTPAPGRAPRGRLPQGRGGRGPSLWGISGLDVPAGARSLPRGGGLVGPGEMRPEEGPRLGGSARGIGPGRRLHPAGRTLRAAPRLRSGWRGASLCIRAAPLPSLSPFPSPEPSTLGSARPRLSPLAMGPVPVPAGGRPEPCGR